MLLNGGGSCPPAGAACGRSGLYEKCPLAEVHLRRTRWFLVRTVRFNGPCTVDNSASLVTGRTKILVWTARPAPDLLRVLVRL